MHAVCFLVLLMLNACRPSAGAVAAANPVAVARPDAASAALGARASESAADLQSQPPATLIELYVFHPDCGFQTFDDKDKYLAALSLNQAITAELERRGEGAAAVCQEHLNDLRNLFTGDGGPQENVARVCNRLLKKLGHPAGDSVPVEFCRHRNAP
jgi:hypothetical protein